MYVCLPEGNELLEGTGLLTEDNLLSKEVAGMSSVVRRDVSRSETQTKPRSLYGDCSPSAIPSLSPRQTSVPVRPRPVPSSVQETADLALAISQQWREDVSAMRKELAELRHDLCTELRAFNSNFSTFTQRYNTWSPRWQKTTQHPSGQVSVSTQAGSKTLVRQNTADAAVNCPSPVDPNVLSMQVPEPLDKNVLQVSPYRPLFRTDPNSQVADLDDPSFVNLTPPEPVDLSSLCWPELDPDPMTPPDPPEPLDITYCLQETTLERVNSIVLDITNLKPVNLANLHWPKLEPEIKHPPQSPFPSESFDRVMHSSVQEPVEVVTACVEYQRHHLTGRSASPFALREPCIDVVDQNVDHGDFVILSPLTPESMDLNDLKWPSMESLDQGLPSPGFLPDPPTPEPAYYDEPADHGDPEDPPFPELLDTIFLQPATPEPTDSDSPSQLSPEPSCSGVQSSSVFKPETHSVILWSKRETFDFMNKEPLKEGSSTIESRRGDSLDTDQFTTYPIPDTLDSVTTELLDSGALFSAILCSVDPDVSDLDAPAMDTTEAQHPGNGSSAIIDPATVHSFNLSLLELQAALDASKKTGTTDNGSPKGTMASSGPSPSSRDFLWVRWQRRLRGRLAMSRSASMELYHKSYSNNSEMSYMSLSI